MKEESLSELGWLPPLPIIDPVILGAKSSVLQYVIENTSSNWVQIQNIGLDGDDDSRVMISGGTCTSGLNIAPGKLCTIEITINPTSVGLINQVLYVQHSGLHSPLWIEISTFVTVTPDAISQKTSFLVQENVEMENNRRLLEQAGHRRFAKVNARERSSVSNTATSEHNIESAVKQHPYFAKNQRYDGIENKITPNPSNNPAAKDNYQSAKEDQELAKQLRLGNMPKFTSTPKPTPY